MARSGTGRDSGTRDVDERLNGNTIAALWAGGSLIVCLILLTVMAGTGMYFGSGLGVGGAKLGLVLGLLVGTIFLGLLLRLNSVRLRARSNNLYRGLWAGLFLALVLLLVMALAPQLLGGAPPPGTNPAS